MAMYDHVLACQHASQKCLNMFVEPGISFWCVADVPVRPPSACGEDIVEAAIFAANDGVGLGPLVKEVIGHVSIVAVGASGEGRNVEVCLWKLVLNEVFVNSTKSDSGSI